MTPARRTHAVAYLRVSTDTQAQKGEGLTDQREAIEAWAKVERFTIDAWYCDEGESGSNGLESRLALAEAIDHLANPDAPATVLVVYKLDRLARDMVLQEQLLATIWRSGGLVRSTSNAESAYLDPDPKDPSRRLIRQVLGAVSEYERAMVSLRMRQGRERKIRHGGFGGGTVPYGYRAVAGELVPHPPEQKVIRQMRRLHASGKSLRTVARELNGAGMLPRTGQWHAYGISRVLDNEARRNP